MFTLLIEKAEPRHGIDYARGVIFDTDPETGAKFVVDTIEAATGYDGHLMIEAVADSYPGWKFEECQFKATNMGRARTNRTMIRKIMEQL